MSMVDEYEKWDLMKQHFDLTAGSADTSEIYPGDIISERGGAVPLGVVLKVEKNSVLVSLDGGGTTIKVNKKDFGKSISKCELCDSEKVYHDSREEWLCPWCEL